MKNQITHRRVSARTIRRVACLVSVVGLSFGVPLVNGDDLPIDGTWVTGGPSVSTENGQLHVSPNGIYDDGWAEKSLSITLSDHNPIIIETRQRLESGGLNYRLPYEEISFGDGSSLWTTYLPTLDYHSPLGWHFSTESGDSSWSGLEEPAVPGTGYWTTATANYWAVIRIVLTPTGGTLFLKPDDAAQGWFSDHFEPVVSTTWSPQSTITKIRFSQPWDAEFTVDYVTIYSIEQLVPCEGPRSGGNWKNHGAYVSAVSREAEKFLAAGLITETQKDVLVSQAAKSKCGGRK